MLDEHGTLKLAVIPGDGIGTEVVAEGLKVLDAAGRQGRDRPRTTWAPSATTPRARPCPTRYSRSCAATTRSCSAPSATRACRPACSSAACCCGCASSSTTTSTCARSSSSPAWRPRSPGPDPRTSTWSSSARAPRARTRAPAACCASGTPHEIATQESLNTAYGVERVVRYAFAKAQAAAAQEAHAGPQDQRAHLRRRPVDAHGGAASRRSSPTSTVDYCHVDAASMFFVTQPERFDVIVTDNLFGDILTDIGAAIAGGIGLAASGNVNPERTAPSMFEPVHGSAPDIAGPGQGRPHRDRPVGRDAARPPRPHRGGRAGSSTPSPPTSPSAGGAGPRSHQPDRRRHRRASSRLTGPLADPSERTAAR